MDGLVRFAYIPPFDGHERAACNNHATLVRADFFPESGPIPSKVKACCNSCPVQRPCLEFAMVNHELGIWGGTSELERERLRRWRSVLESPTPNRKVQHGR